MTDLPEPMTPPESDLKGMPYMPLDVVRLMDSDLFALSTGDEFKAAVALWCKAFLQAPAGSLPDDDRILAHLSGAGSRWPKVRAMALRGWTLCADGRLYHRVVAEKALDAWNARLAQRARTEAARAAKASKRAKTVSDSGPAEQHDSDVTTSVTETATTSVTETVTGSKGEGEGELSKEEKKEPPNPRKRGGGSAALRGFDDFWSAYPRKVAKGAAERAWPKALAAVNGDPDEIVWALKARLHLFDRREDGRFIPHPATWLNGKCWLDGVEPEAGSLFPSPEMRSH